jgi:predicted DNA-binding transcriptional regulator YafY
MYQPTTRLLTVLELLQARGTLSGAELAQRLEVDRRSIRRYITMLQDLGIPIEGVRGPAGGYRLRPGFKLPPLMFTDQEAVALTLALIAVPRLGIAVDPAAISGALAKLERVLPIPARDRVRAVQEVIALESGSPAPAAESDLVALLSYAARSHRRVQFGYRSGAGGATERIVDPYGVVNVGRRWYLAGYCHLRHDLRTFRIDRISAATMLDERFEPPDDIDPLQLVLRSIAAIPGSYQVEVLLSTCLEHARRIISPTYGWLEEADDEVRFRCQINDLDDFARFLVGLNVPFRVVQPEELRGAFARLADELRKAVESMDGMAPASFQLPGSPGSAASSASRDAASS